jgi:hypothetical protein
MDDNGLMTVMDAQNFRELRTIVCGRDPGIPLTSGSLIGFLSQGRLVVYSLLTGEQVSDKMINLPWRLLTAAIDAVGGCVWLIGRTEEQEELELFRMPFRGPLDPVMIDFTYFPVVRNNLPCYQRRAFEMENIVAHFPGQTANLLVASESEMTTLVECTKFFRSRIDEKCTRTVFSLVRVLVVLIDMNLRTKKDELVKLIWLLPDNFGVFLFFSHFDSCSETDAVDLLEKFLFSETVPHVIGFHLKKLEQSEKLGLMKLASLADRIPGDLTATSAISKPFLLFLILHQRALVSAVHRYFSDDEFAGYSQIPILDSFVDYCKLMFGRVQDVAELWDPMALDGSVIFFLFDNFISLLANLTQFHQVAAVAADFFPGVLPQIAAAISCFDANSATFQSLAGFLYLSARFLTTLIGGGILTKLESDFPLLIRANLQFDESQILSPEISGGSGVAAFLSGTTDVMRWVYQYRPRFH